MDVLDRHGTVPVIQSFLSSPTRSTRIRWTNRLLKYRQPAKSLPVISSEFAANCCVCSTYDISGTNLSVSTSTDFDGSSKFRMCLTAVVHSQPSRASSPVQLCLPENRKLTVRGPKTPLQVVFNHARVVIPVARTCSEYKQ